ncbi:hypothetical protein CPLU01_03157 [Colletotrichum plurivorum]|uniref:Protein FAF1 n=1 Tax=Colletotrichum plurivorum TaxID=2175906 RepID=A0A8H6KUC3_9PEZI|nr:hypothetical protein CPLU01_03157 [Colletotrichum plurivorum]
MASILGKRKARTGSSAAKKSKTAPSEAKVVKKSKIVEEEEQQEKKDEEEEVLDPQEIFRRHFEASFAPLPDAAKKGKDKKKSKSKKSKVAVEESSDEDEEDLDEDVGADDEDAGEGEEWDGLSELSPQEESANITETDSEQEDYHETPVVEVVDHSSTKPLPVASMSKRELKAFMSSKPPSQTDPKPIIPTTDAPAEDEDDKSNLANDLALQRLLSESHLLSRHASSPFSNPQAARATKSFAEGKLRQRQVDLRAQALAPGVTSLFKQEKMPMAFRKGMNAKAAGRESKRRAQARENGIVLEREAPKKAKRSRAERSVDGPSVGRMRGAQLTLSERDIRSIEGSGGGMRGGRGGGRGGRR